MIIRRAVAWALDIRDPDDFDTRGYILFPQANLKPGAGGVSPAEFDPTKNITVQLKQVS